MGTTFTDKIVMSIGGSLIVPNGGINTDFLMKLNKFIRTQLAKNKNRQFFLVCGGGSTARHYIEAGKEVLGHGLTDDDKDWLGIHASRLNAHLVRTVLRDIAHPFIIKHYEIIRKVSEPVIIAAAWKPGWSTDFDSILLCEDYNVQEVLNLSNIDKVYDKDPRNNPDAKEIDKISWEKFRKLVGDKWTPGMNAPFDPIASKKAQELGIKVVVMGGENFKNIENYLNGKKFTGTIIE